MICQRCGVREAEIRLIDLTDSGAERRHLCSVCAGVGLQAFEAELARTAHANLPDGPALDAALYLAERRGTPDQRRQLALMLRERAEHEASRMTSFAIEFLSRFAPPDGLPPSAPR